MDFSDSSSELLVRGTRGEENVELSCEFLLQTFPALSAAVALVLWGFSATGSGRA
jgi:hypothetical protein